jgi:hypothetical protein
MTVPENANPPLVRVTHYQDHTNKHCRYGEGSREHFLECGHVRWTKQSYGRPQRMRCSDCLSGRPKDPHHQKLGGGF